MSVRRSREMEESHSSMEVRWYARVHTLHSIIDYKAEEQGSWLSVLSFLREACANMPSTVLRLEIFMTSGNMTSTLNMPIYTANSLSKLLERLAISLPLMYRSMASLRKD